MPCNLTCLTVDSVFFQTRHRSSSSLWKPTTRPLPWLWSPRNWNPSSLKRKQCAYRKSCRAGSLTLPSSVIKINKWWVSGVHSGSTCAVMLKALLMIFNKSVRFKVLNPILMFPASGWIWLSQIVLYLYLSRMTAQWSEQKTSPTKANVMYMYNGQFFFQLHSLWFCVSSIITPSTAWLRQWTLFPEKR